MTLLVKTSDQITGIGQNPNEFLIEDKFYDAGDILHMYARQDALDPNMATHGVFSIEDEAGAVMGTWRLEGVDHVFAVRLLEETYPAGCYSATAWYDTTRADGDEAWNSLDFCIVPGGQTAVPEVTTGVQGKVYTDANKNGRLDIGEPGISGMTVITVNLADFADTQRVTIDQNGDYAVELAAGAYLVQVEGTASYAYVDIASGLTAIQHLGL